MEADPQRPVDLEHIIIEILRASQQSVEGHSLITQHGHYDAIQEEVAQRSVRAHGLHNTMFKAILT